MKTTIFAIGLAVLLTSCSATHTGTLMGSAALGSANFSYVKKDATGSSTAHYIIGAGGLGKETLVAQAKQNMLATYPLKAGQCLANVTVNFKKVITFLCTIPLPV